jgi:hypothetical protein
MALRAGSPLDIKSITVLVLGTVLLSASISSVASLRFDAMPTFFSLGYASIDTSDSEDKQENKAESEDKTETNGDEESSDSNSQEQQTECSSDEALNEETDKCEEIQGANKSAEDNESASVDSSDPDLCLKIRGQIASAKSQEELDSIIIPKQCLASKNEEIGSTQNSEKQEELPKVEDSSSDSNSNSKDSTSNGDSDKSDSKSKSKTKDSNCQEVSTEALAALGEVTVNPCSGDGTSFL